MNQPDTFPTKRGLSSAYRFDPDLFKGDSSWDDLRSILRDAASGCNLSVQRTFQQNGFKKKCYILGCHHSRTYEDRSSVEYDNDKDIGPVDVVTERSKRHKSHGTKRKGEFSNLILVSFYLVYNATEK